MFQSVIARLSQLPIENPQGVGTPPTAQTPPTVVTPPRAETPTRAERSPSIEYLGNFESVKRLPKAPPITEVSGNLLHAEEPPAYVSPIASPVHAEHSASIESSSTSDNLPTNPEEKSYFMQKSENEPAPVTNAISSNVKVSFWLCSQIYFCIKHKITTIFR
jgi:hypothetical protein